MTVLTDQLLQGVECVLQMLASPPRMEVDIG